MWNDEDWTRLREDMRDAIAFACLWGAAATALGAGLFWASFAFACDMNFDLREFKGRFPAKEGYRFADATPGQFHFLEGIYALDPSTPQGLPDADRAEIVSKKGGSDDAIVFWIAKNKVCMLEKLPSIARRLMDQIKTGKGEEL